MGNRIEITKYKTLLMIWCLRCLRLNDERARTACSNAPMYTYIYILFLSICFPFTVLLLLLHVVIYAHIHMHLHLLTRSPIPFEMYKFTFIHTDSDGTPIHPYVFDVCFTSQEKYTKSLRLHSSAKCAII